MGILDGLPIQGGFDGIFCLYTLAGMNWSPWVKLFVIWQDPSEMLRNL